jgi:hypothetical protein
MLIQIEYQTQLMRPVASSDWTASVLLWSHAAVRTGLSLNLGQRV